MVKCMHRSLLSHLRYYENLMPPHITQYLLRFITSLFSCDSIYRPASELFKKKEPTSKRVLRTVTAWERGFNRVSQKIDFFFLLKINQS